MSRLTKKFNDEYYSKNANTIIFNTEIDYNIVQKLGKLEDLEELGCPLEVVFKAVKEGIYCVDYDNQIIRKFIAPLWFNSTSKQFYWSGNNIGYPDLKDYQKTWWLKGER